MLVCYDFFYFLLHFKKLIAHNISQSRSLVISLALFTDTSLNLMFNLCISSIRSSYVKKRNIRSASSKDHINDVKLEFPSIGKKRPGERKIG